ncbi:hypothetical protein AURDEDRAFT_188252 [Auricularia subglabra TFB-10046 SS5]|nr:hypothetical protein AURDEDRAFT_188252 [Auricularia subglabra TFB-10046 SS5]
MAMQTPDDVLHIILGLALAVPEAEFCCALRPSPFANRQDSRLYLLLVCKRWARNAHSWLYRTVVLRSKAQALALSLVLDNNPAFGPLIMQLRVEGGFGDPVGKIMLAATRLEDIHVVLEYRIDREDTDAMCDALSGISPRRLIINEPEPNIPEYSIFDDLAASIDCWSRLESLTIAGTQLSAHYGSLIQELVTSADRPLILYVQGPVRSILVLERLLELPGLSLVHLDARALFACTAGISGLEMTVQQAEQLLRKFPGRVLFEGASSLDVAFPQAFRKGMNYTPLQNAPSADCELIWARIINFALFRTRREKEFLRWNGFIKDTAVEIRVGRIYPAVCHLFKRVCKLIRLRDEGHDCCDDQVLPTNTIKFTICYSHANDATMERLSTVSALEILFATRLAPQLIHKIAGACGKTLKQLAVNFDDTGALPATDLAPARFPALRRLSLAGTPQVLWRVSEDIKTLRLELPLLEELHVGWEATGVDATEDILRLMSRSMMPSIRMFGLFNLVSDDFYPDYVRNLDRQISQSHSLRDPLEGSLRAFFLAHGKSLRDVELFETQVESAGVHCPNMQTLRLFDGNDTGEWVAPSTFASGGVSLSVTSLHLRALPVSEQPMNRKELVSVKKATAFFAALAKHAKRKLPALREVHIAELVWPTIPYRISASPVVRWAEQLSDAGLQLRDMHGIAWVPRMEPRDNVSWEDDEEYDDDGGDSDDDVDLDEDEEEDDERDAEESDLGERDDTGSDEQADEGGATETDDEDTE